MWSTDTCYQVPLLFPNMADRLCETNLHVRITKIQLETNSPRRKRAGAWELSGSAGHWAYRLGVQPAKIKTAKLFTENAFTTLTLITLSGIKRRSLYNTVFFCGLSNAVFSCDRLNDAKPEKPLFPVWVKTRYFFVLFFFFKERKNTESGGKLTLYLLHPYIRIHILQTCLYTFPLVLTRRIRITIKAS